MRLPRALSISATRRVFFTKTMTAKLRFAVSRVLLSEAAAVRRGTALFRWPHGFNGVPGRLARSDGRGERSRAPRKGAGQQHSLTDDPAGRVHPYFLSHPLADFEE